IKSMKMGGQFAPETGWSVCSGKQLKSDLFRGGQFAPESGGQFDRILQYAIENKIYLVFQNRPLSFDYKNHRKSKLMHFTHSDQ
ncbi:MAG: hypothetical protein NTU98_00005, partial [Bacteroidetes bacterium]|nr:hypothetical protein [Bacteroidota bacterium]